MRFAFVVAALLPACAGGEKSEAVASQAAAQSKFNACSLVTRAEAEQAAGRPVVEMGPINASYPELSCRFTFGKDTTLELGLGPAAGAQGADGVALARYLKEETFPSGMDWKPLAGLPFPAAELSDVGIVIARKGETKIQFTALGVPHEVGKRLLPTAVGRMP